MKSERSRPWLRLYRLALRALPPDFRARHAGELEQLVAERLGDAQREAEGGRRTAVWRRALSEMTDVAKVGTLLRLEHWSRRDSASRAASAIAIPDSSGGLPMRTALRSLIRRPAFTALAVSTLALGIGASTATFAAVDAILVRPLEHVDGDRLVMLWRVIPRLGFERAPASYPDYLDWRAQTPALADLGAYRGVAATMLTDGDPERLIGARVSGNLFRLLGNEAAIGRVIVDDDDRSATERVIVLGDPIWRRRFAADTSVLGRSIVLDDVPHVVVGVMPPEFVFPSARAEFWVPLGIDPATAERDANFLTLVGRLRPNATLDLAGAQVEAVASRIASAYPEMNEGYGVRLERRHDFVVEPVRPVLTLVGAAVAVLLGIAMANLANLQLVRGAGRRRDSAVRRALGATGSHLSRARFAESLWIAVLGALAGIGVAFWLTTALQQFGPPLPRGSEIGIDARAVSFAAVVALVCAVIATTAGGLAERSVSLGEAIAGGWRSSAGRGVHRTQELLVVAQLALALTLFVGAGLLGRSFYRLATVPRGFEGEHVLTGRLSLPPSRYGSARVLGFYDQLLERLSIVPGAEVVSGTWALPFSADWASSDLVPADRSAPEDPPTVTMSPVRPRFFEAVGVPLLAGRDFTAADGSDAAPVAIINETLARRFWPGESAVGRQIRSADPDDGDQPWTIVGVVGDLRRRGLAIPVEPEIYLPHAQAAWTGDLYVTVRVAGDPYALAPALRRAVAELDPQLPVTNLATLDELVDASMIGPRFRSLLVGGFAVLAGLLAVIGIYGVLVFAVAQRRREIAVRAALGATPRRVLTEILRRGMRVVGIGIALGVLGAVAATPIVRALLFDIDPFDAVSYGSGIVLLAGVAVVGSWIPARRAARVDPMLTLREEG